MSARITWKTDFEIGVPAIDDQHKRLFAMLDALHRPDDQVKLNDLLLSLGRYIEEHFAFEENLMRKHAYPRITEHLVQHHELIARYRAMTSGVDDQDPQAVGRTRMVVYAWFTRHILGDRMDKDLGQHLKRIGLFLR